MNKDNFFDNYFKFLTLIFWPIIFYKRFFIYNPSIEYTYFTVFSTLAMLYIFLFILFAFKYKSVKNIMVSYRISSLLAFIFTLFSYLLYPKSLMWLFLKVLFISIYFYFSFIKVFKYKLDEGVVGMLSSLLLFVVTLFY